MSKTAPETAPLTDPLAVAGLHGEVFHRIAPDAEARGRLARAFGLHSVSRFLAEFTVKPFPNGTVDVTGTVQADVEPLCVVSLEPFPQSITQAVDVRFAPADVAERLQKRAEADEDEGFELPDFIENGMIDLGALAVEFMALALDPYPKKPGAAFAGGDGEGKPVSPFEALLALKLKDSP